MRSVNKLKISSRPMPVESVTGEGALVVFVFR